MTCYEACGEDYKQTLEETMNSSSAQFLHRRKNLLMKAILGAN